MRNFVVSMIVVFLVLCVPWFCVAQADYMDCDTYNECALKGNYVRMRELSRATEPSEDIETLQERRERKNQERLLDEIEKHLRYERYGY